MSEIENTPVAIEAAPEEAEVKRAEAPVETATEPAAVAPAEPPVAATAPEAAVAVEAAPPVAVADEPAQQEVVAAEPVEGAAVEPGAKPAKAGARKSRRAKPRRGGKVDEVVPPTPEDLAGIHSEKVRVALEAGHPVEGTVIGWNQGGFHVAVDGVTGFCPRSSMELGHPKEPAAYLDQNYAFRVLRVEEKGHRLVLSRAAMLREERKHHAEELRRSIQVGQVMKGKVVSLTDFGAFVDLGGVEGLVHVSEIRHARVAKPGDALALGQEVEAKVLKLASGGDRISLSLKALEPDPWSGVAERYPAAGKFSGKILRKSEFGWFIELEPGIEGLLHTSQLLPGMHADDTRLAPGETIEGFVREVDSKRHRISLSLRETPTGDPWQGAERRYEEGSIHEGTVEKAERFGVFVILEPGLTGLLPGSELGLPRGANVNRLYSVGKKVKVQIAQIDTRRRRISLTLEGKTLEGSRSDYQTYVKQTRKATGMGALAAAFEKIRPGG